MQLVMKKWAYVSQVLELLSQFSKQNFEKSKIHFALFIDNKNIITDHKSLFKKQKVNGACLFFNLLTLVSFYYIGETFLRPYLV